MLDDARMGTPAKVALLIDTATTWGSGLIEGIAQYAHESEDWHIFLGPRGKYDRLQLPEHWHGDGVIARVTHQELAQQILDRGIPAVNVSWYRFGGNAIPRCTCDAESIAELAVNYFLDRGFRNFAYCASALRPDYQDRVGEAFVDLLDKQNYGCHCFTPHGDPDSFLPTPEDLDRLMRWLRELPSPMALLAFDSVQARHVTEACHLAGIEVPHNVAVLGGEHDLLSCTVSNPQLSSIDHSPFQVGVAAASLLSRLMAGESPPSEPILLPATRIITRQSTDTVALEDELLAACVRFIKSHSHERIKVSDILREVPISRRALEKGFRKHLARSPAEEIRRVRVEHAVTLLCDTSWPMPKIAVACGFERPELLTRALRRDLNITPSECRRRHQRSRKALSASESEYRGLDNNASEEKSG